MRYRKIKKLVSLFILTFIVLAVGSINFSEVITAQNPAQAKLDHPIYEENKYREAISDGSLDDHFTILENKINDISHLLNGSREMDSHEFLYAYDIAYDLLALAKSTEVVGDELIRTQSLNHAERILRALSNDITDLGKLFQYSFDDSVDGLRRSLSWKTSSIKDDKVQRDIKVLELFQQVLVFQGQQSLSEKNRVDNGSHFNLLEEALITSEYMRTFSIDFQLIKNYGSLMKEVFDAIADKKSIDRLDDIRLSKASDIFSQFEPPSIKDIKEVAQNENATLVFYSINSNNSNKNILLPKQLYIWVVNPSGKISFIDQSSVEEFQGSVNDFTLLKKLECERPSENLSNSCRSALIAMADEGVRGVRESMGITDRNLPVEQLQEQDEIINSLYQLLISPIKDLLPIDNPEEKVIFIPDGSLHFIPFAALKNPENGKYLVEDHTIVVVPNIRTLYPSLNKSEDRWHQDQLSLDRKKALVVGNPDPMPDSSLRMLPGAEKEAHDIADLLDDKGFKVDRYTLKEATKRRVIKKMQDSPAIIHFATHGIINPVKEKLGGRAFSSKVSGSIALAGEYLDASEVFNINLPDTELVVLSACNTGVGPLVPGGVIGLPFSFSASGAPSVLMSLWDIPDEQTAELMNSFYKYWIDGKDKAQSLRLAMMEMIQDYPNSPKYWAAFTLVGSSK